MSVCLNLGYLAACSQNNYKHSQHAAEHWNMKETTHKKIKCCLTTSFFIWPLSSCLSCVLDEYLMIFRMSKQDAHIGVRGSVCRCVCTLDILFCGTGSSFCLKQWGHPASSPHQCLESLCLIFFFLFLCLSLTHTESLYLSFNWFQRLVPVNKSAYYLSVNCKHLCKIHIHK